MEENKYKFGIKLEQTELPTDPPERVQGYQIPRQNAGAPDLDYDVMDNMRAAFSASKFNLMFNRYTDSDVENLKEMDVTGVEEVGFDKWGAFEKAGYKPAQASFYERNVNSYKDFLIYKDKFEKTTKAKEVMASSGITGLTASLLSETIGDPIFLATLPIGVAGKAPSAIKFAIAGGAGSAASEAGALVIDPTKTGKEAVINIAAGTVVGGVLGGAVDTFTALSRAGKIKSGKTFDEFSEKVIAESRAVPVDPIDVINTKSAGSMAVKPADYGPGGTKAGQLAAKLFAPLSPSNRSANYISPDSQKLNAVVAGNPLYITKASEEGVVMGDTIPDMLQRTMTDYTRVSAGIYDTLMNISKTTKARLPELQEKLYAIAQDNKIDNDMLEAMSKRGEADDGLYAAALRQRERQLRTREDMEGFEVEGFRSRRLYAFPAIFSRIKSRLDMDGLRAKIIEDYKEKSNLMRSKYAKTIASKERFKKHLESEKAQYIRQLDKNGRNYAEILADIDEEIDELLKLSVAAEEDFGVWADRQLTEILHGKTSDMNYLGIGKARKYPGFFLPREIDPLKYQPWLETDFAKLNASYGRSAGAKIAFKRLLGDNTGETALKEYAEKMDDAISKARTSGDAKLSERLAKEKASVLNDAQRLLRQHEGTYASEFYQENPTIASTLELANNMISFASLGNSVLGSIGEAAAIQLHHGITKIAPSYAKVLKKMASDPEFRAMAKADLQATGRALELANNAMVGDIVLEGGNLGDAAVKGFRVMETAKKYYYRLNGQVYYDYMLRTVNGLTQQTMLYKNIKKMASGKYSNGVRDELARLGIGESDAKKIFSYMDEHSTFDEGLIFLNVGKWQDETMVERVRTALDRDMRRTTMMARTGDLPVVMAHPAMRLLLKFKQWPLLATQNYMVPLIQRGDAAALSGAMAMAGFGSLSYMARELAAGRDIPDNPSDILYAGTELSGVAGITPELGLNYLANYAGISGGGAGFIGYNSLLEQSIGPAAGYIKNIDRASDLLPGGDEAGMNDLKYLYRLLPLNNHPFSKQIEKALGE